MPVGSFNLLINYDAEGLYFLSARAVGLIADWEHFTYRFAEEDTCGGGCPMASLRLIGVADLPDGEDPGDVYLPEGEMIRLLFHVTEDKSYMGRHWALNWSWSDCDDNSLTSVAGDSVFMATDITTILPEQDCRNPTEGNPGYAEIHFGDGVVCDQPLECPNDINLNGVRYDVGEAVLFTNYFIYGPMVWDPIYYQNQIFATDVNEDGTPLTMADLVYLINIISGEADPYPSGE